MTLPGFDAAVQRAGQRTWQLRAGVGDHERAIAAEVRPIFEEVVGALATARFIMTEARGTGAHPLTDEALGVCAVRVDALLARLRGEPKEGKS